MIAVIGANGYVGSAVVESLNSKGVSHAAILHSNLDIQRAISFVEFIEKNRVTAVINCAGWCGKTVDECEEDPFRCYQANLELPRRLGIACAATATALYHVSSGCYFSGGTFTERSKPNLPTGVYRKSKLEAEQTLLAQNNSQARIFRIRMPFDHRPSQRNLLDKLMGHAKLVDHLNSITSLSDFADLLVTDATMPVTRVRLPVGVYNATNPGPMRTSEIAAEIAKVTLFDKEWFTSDKEFNPTVAVQRSQCVLATDKLASFGYTLRPTVEALRESLQKRFTS